MSFRPSRYLLGMQCGHTHLLPILPQKRNLSGNVITILKLHAKKTFICVDSTNISLGSTLNLEGQE